MKIKKICCVLGVLMSIVIGVNLLVSSPVLAQSAGSDSANVDLQALLDEIEAKIKAISVEIARISAGLPPNTQSGAYSAPVTNTSPSTSSAGASASGSSGGGYANNPFGGLVTMTNRSECDCSQHTKVYINPAKSDLPREVLYKPPQSKTYEFGQVAPGRHVLGTWETKAVCMKRISYGCVPRGVYPLIAMVGTSGGGSGGNTPPPADDGGNGEQQPPATTTPPVAPSPNCDRNSLGGWNFNPGIQNQIGDASESLKDLLYCMCNKLSPQGIKGLITSISDGNHIGRLNECRNPSTYQQCGSVSSCCYHSRTSCHYGGDNADNKSYAVDVGMSNADQVRTAARSCLAGNYINEGNHLHIATFDCRGD